MIETSTSETAATGRAGSAVDIRGYRKLTLGREPQQTKRHISSLTPSRGAADSPIPALRCSSRGQRSPACPLGIDNTTGRPIRLRARARSSKSTRTVSRPPPPCNLTLDRRSRRTQWEYPRPCRTARAMVHIAATVARPFKPLAISLCAIAAARAAARFANWTGRGRRLILLVHASILRPQFSECKGERAFVDTTAISSIDLGAGSRTALAAGICSTKAPHIVRPNRDVFKPAITSLARTSLVASDRCI